jgi:hypothetical protein
MPTLVAEVARDDPPPLDCRSRLVAVVADDGPAVLVLEAVAVAVFLANRAAPARFGESASRFFLDVCWRRMDIRDLGRRTVLDRVDELAVRARRDWLKA